MRVTAKISLLCLLVVAVSSIVVFGVASAQNEPMTDEQMVRIRSSCISAKNTLNRLHESDALLRINRGQVYESMSTKLMARFNGRAQSSHFDAKDLVTVTESYVSTLTKFRDDYKDYEVQLYAALNVDCTKEPVSFYDAVAGARSKRTQVHTDVVKLHQYIDEYRVAFDLFTTDFYKTDGDN